MREWGNDNTGEGWIPVFKEASCRSKSATTVFKEMFCLAYEILSKEKRFTLSFPHKWVPKNKEVKHKGLDTRLWGSFIYLLKCAAGLSPVLL
jgi:hypothetical protein